MDFSVTHEGRGGHILCVYKGTQISLCIEMAHGGIFIVSLQDLSPGQYAIVEPQLKSWLVKTGRSDWVFEGLPSRSDA
jgi:hypothetical protein